MLPELTHQAICIVGAGRMGRGIAQSYALAGVSALLVDLKKRPKEDFQLLCSKVYGEIGKDLDFLVAAGLLKPEEVSPILSRIRTIAAVDAAQAIESAQIIYEAVPETMSAKQPAFGWISEIAREQTVVASTTSTLGVEELADLIKHPTRFLNAHWLNPAHLMPLVEISVSQRTAIECGFKRSLQHIG